MWIKILFYNNKTLWKAFPCLCLIISVFQTHLKYISSPLSTHTSTSPFLSQWLYFHFVPIIWFYKPFWYMCFMKSGTYNEVILTEHYRAKTCSHCIASLYYIRSNLLVQISDNAWPFNTLRFTHFTPEIEKILRQKNAVWTADCKKISLWRRNNRFNFEEKKWENWCIIIVR